MLNTEITNKIPRMKIERNLTLQILKCVVTVSKSLWPRHRNNRIHRSMEQNGTQKSTVRAEFCINEDKRKYSIVLRRLSIGLKIRMDPRLILSPQKRFWMMKGLKKKKMKLYNYWRKLWIFER